MPVGPAALPNVIAVVIPTMPGREESLERTVSSYEERTDSSLRIIVIHDAETCGSGWQSGALLAQDSMADGDYLHFTADDIVPEFAWDVPAIEAVDRGYIPAGTVCVPDQATLTWRGGTPFPFAPGIRELFYERDDSSPKNFPDWMPARMVPFEYGHQEYASVPFCSMAQWKRIGPMIPLTYGTDKWFSYRARAAGIPVVARHGMRFFHYVCQAGRLPFADWAHVEILTFDMVIAYPDYESGRLAPTEPHPLRGTREGHRRTRIWYEASVPGPYPWNEPDWNRASPL